MVLDPEAEKPNKMSCTGFSREQRGRPLTDFKHQLPQNSSVGQNHVARTDFFYDITADPIFFPADFAIYDCHPLGRIR